MANNLQLQMNWQNSLKKRKNEPPLGFRNLGNTCYLNSVIQCLTYTPPLANFCLRLQHSLSCDSLGHQDKKSECPFCLLEKRIVRSLSVDLPLDTPSRIIGRLSTFAEHFRVGRQEDAHEFLRYVIDACHTTCVRLKKPQQQRHKFVSNGGSDGKLVSNGGGDGFGVSTVVKEIFGGALQSQVKCLGCGNESNKVDEIMDISIDVLNSSSLKDAFHKFFQPEILDGNNKYKCDSCKKLVSAKKQMSILQAPNILVIQLKRFDGIFGRKIDKAISFEEVLVLSSFMCKASQDHCPEYKLFATIVHSGFSPDSGHYYAYIKDAVGRWYCCNDSYVSVSNLQEVLSEKVYILFFSRTKQRAALPNKSFATNGTKSCESNGSDISKIPKFGHDVKSTDSQQFVDHHLRKANSATSSKVDKVIFSVQRKPGISGSGVTKKFPATFDMKTIVHNKENNDNNGDAKPSNLEKTSEKKIAVLEDKNGISQNKHVANGNGEIHRNGNGSVADGCKSNATRNGTATSKVLGCQEVHNGSNKSLPNNSDLKRKHVEQKSCNLPADDHHSLANREELKESLKKEAFSFLLKCGYADEVRNFMHVKKLRTRDEGNDTSNELKRKLIADTKATFISRIPEQLKTDLIDHIRAHIDP